MARTADRPGRVLHPGGPGPRRLTPETLLAIPRVGGPAPSPDGRWAAVPVATHDPAQAEPRSRLWLLDLAGGTAPRPLTAAGGSASAPVFAPDGRRIAYLKKAPGGKPQLHVLRLDGGEGERLGDFPLGVTDLRWLPDGTGLVVAAPVLAGFLTLEATRTELARREKDPVKVHATEDRIYRYWDRWLVGGDVMHLFLVDAATGAVRDLTPDVSWWFDWMEPRGRYDLAPDGREIVVEAGFIDRRRDLLRSGLFAVAVGAPGPAPAAPVALTMDHPAEDVWPRYAPDGSSIVYGHTEDPLFYADRVRLWRMDRKTGRHAAWLADWPLSPVKWEWADGRTLVFQAEAEGRTRAYAWDGSGVPRALTRDGSVAGLAPTAGGRVLGTWQSLARPPEVHVLSLTGGEPVACSTFTAAALDGVAMGEVREWAVKGAEGVDVQVLLVFPPDGAASPPPLVQVVHGGPHGISPDAFHFRWSAQAFAAPGYVAALVNFQGSTSWGQDFAKRIQGAWGDRPTRDVLAATDALIAAGAVDPARLAVAGGSYGGYLTAWICGQTDRFRCAVNHAGVYDTLAQYASDVTQGRARSFGGEPWDGLDRIDRWNPARGSAGFRTPMLVIHGEKDYRVPVAQGLECYGVLKAKGVPARLLYFPEEGHWIQKAGNSLRWYQEVLGWLDRWLRADSGGRSVGPGQAARVPPESA